MDVYNYPVDESQLFGGDSSPGIVSIERFGESGVRIYHRDGVETRETREEFHPWLITSASATSLLQGAEVSTSQLAGDAQLCLRATFDSWKSWMEAQRRIRDSNLPIIGFQSVAEQYLVETGRGFFRGMRFEQLRRAQVDIETLGLDPADPDARIIVITAAINGQAPIVLRADELPESDLIDAFAQWIHQEDPDVIEGHNLFNFDLPYLVERARRHGRTLDLGRDGSSVRLTSEQRFKAGARTIPYQGVYVYGRHCIDTYQQIQRYDAAGQLDSYALKPAVQALGLSRPDRTYVEGVDIAAAWERERETLIRYAVDDVIDVNTLSELALPTEFYQARIIPRALQAVATGGPGEKINGLLIRAYVQTGQSIPLPSPPRDYPGGYAELRRAGIFTPVVKCDVESLYPSIMLARAIAPASDRLNVFLPMLDVLTRRRLHAKREEQRTTGKDRALWRGIQSSFKVLINSFYGYLGYGRGYFNDYDAAERVTLRGQDIIRHIVEELETRQAMTIEIDTDGVFFQPPPSIVDEAQELRLIESINAGLDEGIRLAHDGRYRGMLSLKLKNYALLTYDGRVILKGSGMRSRRDERFLRQFVHDIVPRLLDPDAHGSPRDYYLDLAERIVAGELRPEDFSRSETITEQTFTSPANRRLAEAIAGERVGERVQIYQRIDGSLRRTAEYRDDEDRSYLLKRLRDFAERLRPLFGDADEFNHTFPAVTMRSDLNALRDANRMTQLNLFGS